MTEAGTLADKAQDKYSKTTLFVRNLPFDCRNCDLEAFFSEFGPLKGCFVVKDTTAPESDTTITNKGFGFVHFALPEDAIKTLEALKDKKFHDRRLKVDWALKKHLISNRSLERALPIPKTLILKPNPDKLIDPRRLKDCTKLIVTFEQELDGKLVKSLARKLRRFGAIELLAPNYENNPKRVLVEFVNTKDVTSAYRKLFGKINQCLINPSTDQNASKIISIVSIVPVIPESIKSFRLIIRNLPFSIVRPTQLYQYLTCYGELEEVNIPTIENELAHGKKDAIRGKGFAFVQYKQKEDAEKAISSLNGTMIKDRIVAVDWALAKNVFNLVEGNKNKNEDMVGGRSEGAEGIDSENSESDQKEIDAEDSELDQSEIESDQGEAGSECKVNDLEIKDKDQVSGNDTIFIRNLSFDTEEEVLENYFNQNWGETVYCKIVRNNDTGASRGTAFVKFSSPKVASKVIDTANLALKTLAEGNDSIVRGVEESLANLTERRTKKGFRSIITDPDAMIGSATEGSDKNNAFVNGIIVDGRILKLSFAVNRSEAADLGRRNALEKIENILNSDGHDRLLEQIFLDRTESNKISRQKRNMVLIHEALPVPHPDISNSELKTREIVVQGRIKSSSNNANLVLSTTRLAVHHLPPRVDEKMLKAMMLNGIKHALELIKKNPESLNLTKRLGKAALSLVPSLRQVKLICHDSKKSSATKKGPKRHKAEKAKDSIKTRGYGFVEWKDPLAALLCVRYFRNVEVWCKSACHKLIEDRAKFILGDNPEIEGFIKFPVVEFATEKLSVLKQRQDRAKPNAGQGKPMKRKDPGKRPEGKRFKKVKG